MRHSALAETAAYRDGQLLYGTFMNYPCGAPPVCLSSPPKPTKVNLHPQPLRRKG
jgi:hypothetical protein